MALNFSNDKPIFEQIIDYIVMKISTNEYAQDERILSVRDYALQLGVNPNTVQRALTELERVGVLYSRRGEGRFVGNVQLAKDMRIKVAKERASAFFNEMLRMGYSAEQAFEILKEVGNGNSSN